MSWCWSQRVRLSSEYLERTSQKNTTPSIHTQYIRTGRLGAISEPRASWSDYRQHVQDPGVVYSPPETEKAGISLRLSMLSLLFSAQSWSHWMTESDTKRIRIREEVWKGRLRLTSRLADPLSPHMCGLRVFIPSFRPMRGTSQNPSAVHIQCQG